MLSKTEIKRYQKEYEKFTRWNSKLDDQGEVLTEVSHTTRPHIVGHKKNLDVRSMFSPEIGDLVARSNKIVSQYLLASFTLFATESYQALVEESDPQLIVSYFTIFCEALSQAWEKIIDAVADSPDGLETLIGFLFAWDGTGYFGMDLIVDLLSDYFIAQNPNQEITDFSHSFVTRFGKYGFSRETPDSIAHCPYHSSSAIFEGHIQTLFTNLSVPQVDANSEEESQLTDASIESNTYILERIDAALRKALREKGFLK